MEILSLAVAQPGGKFVPVTVKTVPAGPTAGATVMVSAVIGVADTREEIKSTPTILSKPTTPSREFFIRRLSFQRVSRHSLGFSGG
jgi:hypothetical protein